MAGNAGTGNVIIGGAIDTSGSGVDGCSGPVDVTATGGNVAIHAPITLKGPGVDDITVTADGSIDSNAAGAIDASDTLPGDFAGAIVFTATGAGNVTLDGDITATATGDKDNGGGSGAELDVFTQSGSVELAGQVDVSCSGPDALGGVVNVQAGLDLTLSGPIDAGTGNAGTGGAVSMSAQRFALHRVLDRRPRRHHGRDNRAHVRRLADGAGRRREQSPGEAARRRDRRAGRRAAASRSPRAR